MLHEGNPDLSTCITYPVVQDEEQWQAQASGEQQWASLEEAWRDVRVAMCQQADGESQGFTRFDMSDEQDDGHFDEAGNFVWNAEDRSVQEEAWLDGVSEDQMGAALRAKVSQ